MTKLDTTIPPADTPAWRGSGARPNADTLVTIPSEARSACNLVGPIVGRGCTVRGGGVPVKTVTLSPCHRAGDTVQCLVPGNMLPGRDWTALPTWPRSMSWLD